MTVEGRDSEDVFPERDPQFETYASRVAGTASPNRRYLVIERGRSDATTLQLEGISDAELDMLTTVVFERACSVNRLAGDAALFATLKESGFAGPAWGKFRHALIEYAIGVLDAWMRSGHLPEMFRLNEVWSVPSQRESERIVYDAEFRTSLLDTAVMDALYSFRRRALDGTGWRADGGATLTTYFIVACLHAVSNELAKHRRMEERDHKAHKAALRQESDRPRHDHHVADPSQEAIDNVILQQYLGELSPRDRNIVWGKANGYSNREIAEIYGERSVRAVEHRWSTLTKSVDWIGRLAGKE